MHLADVEGIEIQGRFGDSGTKLRRGTVSHMVRFNLQRRSSKLSGPTADPEVPSKPKGP